MLWHTNWGLVCNKIINHGLNPGLNPGLFSLPFKIYIIHYGPFTNYVSTKVIIEKSRSEGSLMEQDTIENVS